MSCEYSVAEDWQEEAGDVLLLPLENDGTILIRLCLSSHQIEELLKGDQVIVEGLRLQRRCDAPPTGGPTATHLTLVCIVLTTVVAATSMDKLVQFILLR